MPPKSGDNQGVSARYFKALEMTVSTENNRKKKRNICFERLIISLVIKVVHLKVLACTNDVLSLI